MIDSSKKRGLRRLLKKWRPYIVLILIAFLYTIFSYTTPLCLDDYMFISRWENASGDGSFSLSSYINFVKTNRADDNFRIANMITPWALYFNPTKTLWPLFTGLIMSCIVYMIGKLSIPSRYHSSSFLYALIWLGMILFLPWRTVFTVDCALNYIWGTAISLLVLIMLKTIIKRKISKKVLGISFIIAFIAGGWHEGFALSTLSGIFLYILFRKGNLPLRFYVFTAVYLLSTLFFLWSPGIWKRIDETMGGIQFGGSLQVLIAVFLVIALLLVSTVTPRQRTIIMRSRKNPAFFIGLGIMMSGMAIGMLTDNSPRSYFWVGIMSITELIILIQNFGMLNLKTKAKRLITLLTVLICSGQTILCIGKEYDINKENQKIISLMEESPDGIVFYDIKTPDELEWYYNEMPAFHIWQIPWQYNLLRERLKKSYGSVVPSVLEHAQIDFIEPIRINPNFYDIDGYIVSENYLTSEWSQYHLGMDELRFPEEKELQFDVTDNFKRGSHVDAYPFITAPYRHIDGSFQCDTLLYYKNKFML